METQPMDPRLDPPSASSARPAEGTVPAPIEARVEAAQRLAGRLARRLVRDPARADDVAQQAVLAALTHPPRAGWAPVAWLSGVTRNLVRKERRSDARRGRRERIAARAESIPSTGELVARLDEQRALLAAVLALDEPYREAILLRYFEGLPPREIARTRGLPIDTVRSHLRRGLATLRERLDASHGGDRRAWCVALLPLARGPAIVAGPSVPVLAAAAAAMLLAVGGTVTLVRAGAPSSPAPLGGEAAANEGVERAAPAPAGAGTLAAAPRVERLATSTGTAWISGRVTADGRPASGIRVTATPLDGRRSGFGRLDWLFADRDPAEVLTSTVTDVDGRFRLPGLAPRSWVRVEAFPGGDAVGEAISVAPTELGASGVLLALHAASASLGRIEPVPGAGAVATVTFRASGPGGTSPEAGVDATLEVVARADAQGKFAVRLPPGSYRCSAYAPGRVLWDLSGVGAPWEGEKVFRLAPPGSAILEGKITDAAGRPVDAARIGITVMTEAQGTGTFATIADAEGRYRFEGLPAGRLWIVRGQKDGFGPIPRKSLAVPLRDGETATLDLRLPREVVLTGRVLDPEGAPVAGADVAVFDQGGEGWVDLRSDAEGGFRVGGLPADEIYVGVRCARGATTAHLEGIAEGAHVERDLVLQAGRTVRGRVVDALDHPVVGAIVTAQSQEVLSRLGVGLDLTAAVGTSGADGAFVLEGLLPADDWAITARTDGAAIADADVVRTRVTLTEEPAVLVLHLVALGAIEGRVVAVDGHGVGGASVHLREKGGLEPRRGRTGPDGRYVFEGVAPGEAVVEATNVLRERPSASATTVVVGGSRSRGVDLHVEASYLASGTITNTDGQPVARAQVTLELEDAPPGLPRTAFADTDDGGRFEAPGLVPGRYRVRVREQEATPKLEAGARGVALSVISAGRAWIEGDVTDPEGKPVAGFVLSHRTTTGEATFSNTDEVSGAHFRVRAPAPAAGVSWGLSITDARGEGGRPLDVQPYVLGAVPSGPLHVRLVAGRTVVGRVIGEDGAPVAGTQLIAVPEGTLSPELQSVAFGSWAADSAPDGSFRLSGLPPGRIVLHVQARAPFLSPASPITVDAGAGDVEIRLARGREIRGTVVGPDGAPAAGFQVSLQAEGPDVLPGRRCTVEADGSFRLEGVPAVDRVALRVSRAPNALGESALLSITVHAVAVGGEPVSIRLRSGVFVEGTAVGPDGAVVSRGAVVADLRGRAHDGSPVFVDGRLDAQGRFRVGPLDPGPVLLFYEGMMVPWASTRPLPITAPARDVRVPVVRAVTLRGRVLAAAGAAGKAWWNPGVGNLTRLGTPIGPDGGFSLAVPENVPGLLYVGYAADDRFALREGLLAGTDVLDLALQPGQRIEGRLTGLPADKAPALSVVARRGDLVLYGESSPDGTFHIPAVPPGTYRVEIEYGDYVGGADKIEAGSVGVSISVTRR